MDLLCIRTQAICLQHLEGHVGAAFGKGMAKDSKQNEWEYLPEPMRRFGAG